MDMIMAGTWIAPLCARTAGRAGKGYVSQTESGMKSIVYV
jgi:hypothetical protein